MKRLLSFVALLGAVALVAAAACLAAGRWFPAGGPAPLSHAWVHRHLALTPEQDRRLDPIEARFSEKKRHFFELIRVANRELAEAIEDDQADSPRTREAVGRIHMAMGDLQKATLDHVFEMREVLTPEQYRKLLDLTADGLRRQP